MRRLEIDVDEVVRLYTEEGLRGKAIAARLGCSDGVVYGRLKEAGVVATRRAFLPKDEVIARYEAGETCDSLARAYGVSGPTIAWNLRQWGVRMRTHVEAHQPAGRRPCPRTIELRAYMLGFATGDLYVRQVCERGKTIEAACSTTHAEQHALVIGLLGPYGSVYSRGNTVRASLDLSFSFLLEKYVRVVPSWIQGRATTPYLAGYVDAEGSFGVYEGRARFKVDSYDRHVLELLAAWCSEIGVDACLRQVGRCGDSRPDGTTFNGDLWRVNVNDGPSLLRLIATLDPFLRHERRRAAADRARSNVVERLSQRVRS